MQLKSILFGVFLSACSYNLTMQKGPLHPLLEQINCYELKVDSISQLYTNYQTQLRNQQLHKGNAIKKLNHALSLPALKEQYLDSLNKYQTLYDSITNK